MREIMITGVHRTKRYDTSSAMLSPALESTSFRKWINVGLYSKLDETMKVLAIEVKNTIIINLPLS